MTYDEMARIHAAAFAPERGWHADEFESLLASALVTAIFEQDGFALTRTVADETELLTLAVHPDRHRQGVADRILTRWMKSTKAAVYFLEVAEDNTAAHGLYAKHGFATTARRRGYYARPNGPAADALLMQATLTHRQNAESQG